MTDTLIPISLIGNYLYCPYSIYLHNVYMETDDSVYKLKHEKNGDYCRVFFDALIPYKTEAFKYVQSYYRCFMGCKSTAQFPKFYL